MKWTWQQLRSVGYVFDAHRLQCWISHLSAFSKIVGPLRNLLCNTQCNFTPPFRKSPLPPWHPGHMESPGERWKEGWKKPHPTIETRGHGVVGQPSLWSSSPSLHSGYGHAPGRPAVDGQNIQSLDNFTPQHPPNFKVVFFFQGLRRVDKRNQTPQHDMSRTRCLTFWGWGCHANLFLRVWIFCPSTVQLQRLYSQDQTRSTPDSVCGSVAPPRHKHLYQEDVQL